MNTLSDHLSCSPSSISVSYENHELHQTIHSTLALIQPCESPQYHNNKNNEILIILQNVVWICVGRHCILSKKPSILSRILLFIKIWCFRGEIKVIRTFYTVDRCFKTFKTFTLYFHSFTSVFKSIPPCLFLNDTTFPSFIATGWTSETYTLAYSWTKA